MFVLTIFPKPSHLLALLLLCGSASLHADDVVVKDRFKPSIALPSAGMHMQQVHNRFGAPIVVHAAVGKPPITRWDYRHFSVYFEYQRVVHSMQRVDLPEKVTVIVEPSATPTNSPATAPQP